MGPEPTILSSRSLFHVSRAKEAEEPEILLFCSRFMSWTYDGTKLNLTHSRWTDDLDISVYMPHPDWEVVHTSGKRFEVKCDCCPEPCIDITYSLEVRPI